MWFVHPCRPLDVVSGPKDRRSTSPTCFFPLKIQSRGLRCQPRGTGWGKYAGGAWILEGSCRACTSPECCGLLLVVHLKLIKRALCPVVPGSAFDVEVRGLLWLPPGPAPTSALYPPLPSAQWPVERATNKGWSPVVRFTPGRRITSTATKPPSTAQACSRPVSSPASCESALCRPPGEWATGGA